MQHETPTERKPEVTANAETSQCPTADPNAGLHCGGAALSPAQKEYRAWLLEEAKENHQHSRDCYETDLIQSALLFYQLARDQERRAKAIAEGVTT